MEALMIIIILRNDGMFICIDNMRRLFVSERCLSNFDYQSEAATL